ncbi:Hypothetical_protein [Hexamita inflata]|uniref:Hypothetical_protein n=1 Tax=Hexamita inflata TaxID=28002 RepID=A0AA86TPS9_9EUKA|nr:Hypothetical protein HINF_LOCUS11776 [Hexamita inflata]
MFAILYSLQRTLPVAELTSVGTVTTPHKTVYLLDNSSRLDLTAKLFSADKAKFSKNGMRTMVVGAEFTKIKSTTDPKVAPVACDASYADKCYVLLDQNTIDADTHDKVMTKFDSLRTTLSQEYDIVYTSNMVLDVKPQVDYFFATGTLWSTILFIFIIFIYMGISACPALLVEEPMDLPKGEED